MTTRKNAPEGAAKTPDCELVLTRFFAAPRALVFKAWTEPGQLKQWWGPRGFSLPVCDSDLRPGGSYHRVMRGPDQKDYPMRGKFHEVVPPERLVFSAMLDGEDPDHEIRTTVTFDAQEGGTRLTLRQTYHLVSAAKTDGARQGWSQSLDRLAVLIESVADGK